MKSSRLFETDEDVDNEYWISLHNSHTTLSIRDSLENMCMNLFFSPEK
jgi:hypothetical protein